MTRFVENIIVISNSDFHCLSRKSRTQKHCHRSLIELENNWIVFFVLSQLLIFGMANILWSETSCLLLECWIFNKWNFSVLLCQLAERYHSQSTIESASCNFYITKNKFDFDEYFSMWVSNQYWSMQIRLGNYSWKCRKAWNFTFSVFYFIIVAFLYK